ncbi:MAG: dicarboxylate/amino acid:cation symporter [candidate division Zixibacteria bacterium]|jgi:Na+/H+-dicarboxylate symporter|nr:dicarboxylate/amino acid:cation symporter [candidate division Zixibacteria bacterium]
MMTRKSGNIVLAGMIAAAVLGALGGYYLPEFFSSIGFLGTIFLNALKMIVVPLIVASMIVGVTSLGDVRKLGRTAGYTFLYYLSTTALAVITGLILVNLLQPGVGVEQLGTDVSEIVAKGQGKTLLDVLVSLIPSNIVKAAADGDILPLIFFSLLFGAVLSSLGEKGKPVIEFFESLNLAIMKMVTLIIWFAPIGVLAIIGEIVARERGSVADLLSRLGMYVLTVLLGLMIHGAITLPLLLRVFAKRNALSYGANIGQALATAFTTASSSATLPLTMEQVVDRNKVDSRAASFVLPLGATINMDGTAMYEAVAALFIAQVYGVDLTIGQQVVIFFTATLASIGAAGIPHAGTVMMVFVLSAVDLPLEGIGFIWAIDWFLDRCRTTVNVWGDAVGAAIVANTREFSGRADEPLDPHV